MPSKFSSWLRGTVEGRGGRYAAITVTALLVLAYLATCAYKAGIFEEKTLAAIRAAEPGSPDKSKPETRIKLNDSAVFYLAGRYAFTDELYSFEAPPTAPGRPGRDFLYPPFFAILVWPLTLFGFQTFVILWLVINAALTIIAAWVCAKHIAKKKDTAVKWWMWLLPLLLTLRAFDANFRQGQANVLTLLFLAVAFASIGGRREILGGAAYALACVLKITPVLIFPYFILRRKWFFLIGWLLGLMAAIVVIPTLLNGPERAFGQFAAFHGKIVDPFVTKAGENPREGAGQSLHAAVDRFFSPIDATRHDEKEVVLNVAFLSRETRYAIKIVLLSILALITGFAFRRLPKRSPEAALAMEYAAVICFMLIASPISRKASFVVMLIPYLVSVHYLSARTKTATWIFFATVFAFSVFTHTFTSPVWIKKTGSSYLLGLSVMFFGTLLLWAGFIAARSRVNRDVSSEEREK